MPGPTKQDAQMLLTLMEIDLSEPMREARKWLRTQPDGLSLDEFEAKFPRGSDGWENLTTIAIFWETVGSLIRRGLLDEDLAFDTFLDAPPWAKLKGIVLGRRTKENAPAEGENLEWVARRAKNWLKRRGAAIRKPTHPNRHGKRSRTVARQKD